MSLPFGAAQAPDHLAANVMHFARVLRSTGFAIGPDRVDLAVRGLMLGGLGRRDDFRATLAACMIDRPEQIALFEQAFHVFWRDPDLLDRILAMVSPGVERQALSPPSENRRLAAALLGAAAKMPVAAPRRPEELDATLSYSADEHLRKADFDTMSSEEWESAKRLIAQMVPRMQRRATRRMRAANHGRVADWRASLKTCARGHELQPLRYRTARQVATPLVVLADISGSMRKYSRMLLHFAHALSMSEVRTFCFVFGTRLTPISHQLRQRDPDVALAEVVREVDDWSGGTRMSACLHAFNHDWSRRVLAQQATLLLISDGLEHGEVATLGVEIERLSKSCARLIWLNPLLRYAGFEARAAGIKAILPYVDALLPAHNLDSLEALGRLLGEALGRSRRL